jgi:hypothetical protein
VAELGGQTTSGDAARGAGYPDSTAAGPAREQLIAKGLLWTPERGQVAFTIPLFERFILKPGSMTSPLPGTFAERPGCTRFGRFVRL